VADRLARHARACQEALGRLLPSTGPDQVVELPAKYTYGAASVLATTALRSSISRSIA